jgi:hypothetical protein
MKKKLILMLALFTLLASLPMTHLAGDALVVGNKGDADIVVTDIRYAINHEVFQISGGFIEILGSNLRDVEVLFERYGQGFVALGTRVINSETFVKYNFTREETQAFTGRIRIGGQTLNLNTGSFPNIQSSDKQTVNKDDPTRFIIFSGNNLNTINTGNITGTYGSGLSYTSIGTGETPTKLTLNQPLNPGALGFQNIILRQTITSANPVTGAPNIEIEYTYQNAFRIIENLGLQDVRMFPNTGTKGNTATGVLGDEVYFRADNFSDTKNYQVYFLKALDGSDKFTEVNRAQFVSLGLNVNGNEDVLTVRVPSHPDFERRSYFVVLTDVQNGQVVAEQVVLRLDGTPDEFTVIQADYKPSIVSIYPEKGPDTGGNVEIKANYVLSLNIPDLNASGNFLGLPQGQEQDEKLVLTYQDGTYKNEPVSIVRTITAQIGKKVKFYRDSTGEFQLIKGTTDQFIVTTDSVTDAETDPFKDVIIEMQTVMTIKSGVNMGKQFVFNQIIVKKNGFEFEPSTYTPIINTMLPNVIQIEDTASIYSKLKEDTLISIKGSLFLVDRFVDAGGNVITRKPTVLVKKNDNNTFNNRYQLGFFPNEEHTSPDGVKVRGIIKYKATEDALVENVLTDANGRAIQLDMTILDASGKIVDGTGGNQLGTKILIRIPSIALIADGGIKHIQVTNPTRKSEEFGKSSIKSDFVEFIKTSDIPVIESVRPNIITVEGGDEIVITGSNLQNGMRLFLDGEELTNFTRTLDTTGNKTLVTFTAPPGREGTTQVAILNPSGGIDVADFSYVKTFNQNPVFKDFSPKLGTYGTLVIVNGDNFLKPDPTAVTEKGIDAFRLIGSRMIMDGKEVNTYKRDPSGTITFELYTAPATDILIQKEAGKAVYSKFRNNTEVLSGSGDVVKLTNDASGNPAFESGNETYAIRATETGYQAYASNGALVGNATVTFVQATGVTTIAIAGGPTFTAKMDNHLVRIAKDQDGEMRVFLADYTDSITLKSGDSERFTLSYNFEGAPILTNGRDKNYTLRYLAPNSVIAVDALGFTRPIAINDAGIELDGNQLNMITPYIVNPTTGRIDGNLSKVLSKDQILFTVPTLTTGKGYKDLTVMNPDTKSASKIGTNGFYYIAQATSNPIITSIVPDKGSVDGGYYVMISGSDFEDDVKVYVDSVEVPKADTYVALDGSWIKFKMPKSIKKLNEDYGVDELTVPVVLVNPDGGNAHRVNGFTYIIPLSDPVIDRILPTGGSSNGGEIVEIIGYEFRFYEPYENLVGGPNYDLGDPFQDLFKNGKWDDLLAPGVDPNAIKALPETSNPYYSEYYESVILPKIYFGENEAKIVEYSKGFIKVITPPHAAGVVDVYVINNDSGVSNKVKYTYTSTNPTITRIVPNFGRRQGQEPKELYGSKMYRSELYGYRNDNSSAIELLPNVQAFVRFGNITNRNIERTAPNAGLINNQRTSVSLEGGLQVSYYGDLNEVRFTLTENNIIYSRTFTYTNQLVYVPMDMLKNAAGEYYVPNGLKGVNASTYSGNVYEYVKLEISDRRLIVERGYSPRVTYNNENNVTVYTPSYYTVGTVPMTYINTDGGRVSRDFTFTNPASEPKILTVEPKIISFDESKWLVETSVDGGIDIEIVGSDFRADVEVYIGSYKATVKEISTKTINGIVYDLIVANVPKATVNDVDQEYPIMIQNADKGLATSGNLIDLIGPNYKNTTIPIYFVYKKPLSGPRIDTVTPAKTSIFGGNTVTITGSDFREGAYVIIGTRAGVPITNITISDRGTKITFKTPTNMTLGSKTVQVINNDYGVAIKDNGITVVSAPTIDPVVRDSGGNPISRINVTGGQEILLKGTGFATGAKVYFGGEWLPILASDNIPATEHGIFRDDTLHYVKQGILATNVVFVDENTLRVTTPEVTFEGDIKVVVRNADGGTTDDSAKLQYTVPIPKDPTGLKVAVVDNKYIKIYDYKSLDTNYYEIYVYMGTKTNAELTSAGHRDFKYLGITNIEPYKITELPGLDRRDSADRVVFVLKAVNKFGPSGFSNLAALGYEQLKDIKELGPTDTDGGLGVPAGQDYAVVQSGNTVQLNMATQITKPSLTVDLTSRIGATTTDKRIVLPESLVRTGLTSITANLGTTLYRFTPVALNTQTFRTVADYNDAYARITEDSSMTTARAYLTPNIRGKRQVSKVYSIGFDASSNEVVEKFAALSGSLDFTLNYNATGMTLAKEMQIQLYKYNTRTGTYEVVPATLDTNGNKVSARINEAGHYVLLTNY